MPVIIALGLIPYSSEFTLMNFNTNYDDLKSQNKNLYLARDQIIIYRNDIDK